MEERHGDCSPCVVDSFTVFCVPGLRVPPCCELVVGGEPQCWSEGSCLLFDDSFLHRAFHEGEKWPPDGLHVFAYHADFWMTPLRLNCSGVLVLSFLLEPADAASQLLPGFPLTPVPGNVYLTFHLCAKENLFKWNFTGVSVSFLSCRHLRRRPQGGLHGGPLAPQRGRGGATGLGLHFHSSPFGGQRREIGVRRSRRHFLPPDRRRSRCVDNRIWPRPKMF